MPQTAQLGILVACQLLTVAPRGRRVQAFGNDIYTCILGTFMGIISRIEEEIDRLNEQILEGSTFENRDSVNLNALVCLLRYAAWRKPDVLKKWFTREGTETSINKNVVKRFSLYENEKNPDGAQLRIHIFDNAKETAKHDH